MWNLESENSNNFQIFLLFGYAEHGCEGEFILDVWLGLELTEEFFQFSYPAMVYCTEKDTLINF